MQQAKESAVARVLANTITSAARAKEVQEQFKDNPEAWAEVLLLRPRFAVFDPKQGVVLYALVGEGETTLHGIELGTTHNALVPVGEKPERVNKSLALTDTDKATALMASWAQAQAMLHEVKDAFLAAVVAQQPAPAAPPAEGDAKGDEAEAEAEPAEAAPAAST